MKQYFKKTLPFVSTHFLRFTGVLSLVFTVCTMNLSAQAYTLHQVIVLNDGNSLEVANGTNATVGSYDPATGVYQDFDTLAASFGCHVLIDSGYIYVGADSLLIKYDLNTKAKLATQTIQGIREMAISGSQILVTRGTTYPLKSYFQAYDKNSLNLIYQDTTVSHATEGIQVLNDTAYIAINDFGSGSVGKLGVVDLSAQRERREIDLGTGGTNPYSVFVEPTNQKIYTVNDEDWSNSSVTQYNAPSTVINTTSLHLTSGCTGSAYYSGNVYFQAGNDDNIGLFSLSSLTVWDSLQIGKYIYGMGIDSADGYVYVGQTDYSSYGSVFIYNLYGHPIDSFAVDVAPGNFAFDVRATTTGIPKNNFSVNLQVYPNPTDNELHINYTGAYKGRAALKITDVLGREVYQSQINTSSPTTVSLRSFTNGVYFLTVETATGKTVKKIVKE